MGRTGSGKSSLTLSLLRLIPTDGRVIYDGIQIDRLNLEALRSNVTIIPQQPELLVCLGRPVRYIITERYMSSQGQLGKTLTHLENMKT